MQDLENIIFETCKEYYKDLKNEKILEFLKKSFGHVLLNYFENYDTSINKNFTISKNLLYVKLISKTCCQILSKYPNYFDSVLEKISNFIEEGITLVENNLERLEEKMIKDKSIIIQSHLCSDKANIDRIIYNKTSDESWLDKSFKGKITSAKLIKEIDEKYYAYKIKDAAGIELELLKKYKLLLKSNKKSKEYKKKIKKYTKISCELEYEYAERFEEIDKKISINCFKDAGHRYYWLFKETGYIGYKKSSIKCFKKFLDLAENTKDKEILNSYCSIKSFLENLKQKDNHK